MLLRNRGTIRRIRLGRAALRYAEHGWDVTPGACYTGSRFACGRPGCHAVGCHPALERWAEAASHDLATVAGWWRRAPHAVLLATGRAFDVIEVPAYLAGPCLGSHWLGAAGTSGRPVRGPVAMTPTGRWMFFVRRGEPLRPELDGRLDVIRHGPDSWVPAPPTRLPEGPVRWAVPPADTDWRLPDPYPVQQALLSCVDAVLTCQV
jgi:Bifunctional DNA primase/polymerase, N-terminal